MIVDFCRACLQVKSLLHFEGDGLGDGMFMASHAIRYPTFSLRSSATAGVTTQADGTEIVQQPHETVCLAGVAKPYRRIWRLGISH
jgi:hypothetical protein